MSEQKIEFFINNLLSNEARKNALDFIAYLRANEMLFERGEGYWADKLYWMISYRGKYVCFVLIGDPDTKTNSGDWTMWSDDSGSDWFNRFPLDNHMKEIAWKNVDVCANCGSYKNPGGTRKNVFGKSIDNVCITAMKFVNPDVKALECMKKLTEMRKMDIYNHRERPLCCSTGLI